MKILKPKPVPKKKPPIPPFWKFCYPVGTLAEKDGYYWQLREFGHLVNTGMNKVFVKEWVQLDSEEYSKLYWDYWLGKKHWDG